jgi:capsular polysaccharide biosynthesis protein
MTLLELLQLMKKHLKLVVVLPLVCALGMGAYSVLFMRNTYTATTSMYVLVSQDSASSTSLQSDLSASQMVTNDVATLLESDRVLNETASNLGLKNLKSYKVSVTNSTTSRVISLSVTGSDAAGSASVANELAENVSDVAKDVMNVESVNIIDSATTPDSPSGPNRLLYVAVALLAGFFAAVAIVVVADMLNTKVRGQEDLEELLGVPVIGRIPASKGGR